MKWFQCAIVVTFLLAVWMVATGHSLSCYNDAAAETMVNCTGNNTMCWAKATYNISTMPPSIKTAWVRKCTDPSTNTQCTAGKTEVKCTKDENDAKIYMCLQCCTSDNCNKQNAYITFLSGDERITSSLVALTLSFAYMLYGFILH